MITLSRTGLVGIAGRFSGRRSVSHYVLRAGPDEQRQEPRREVLLEVRQPLRGWEMHGRKHVEIVLDPLKGERREVWSAVRREAAGNSRRADLVQFVGVVDQPSI